MSFIQDAILRIPPIRRLHASRNTLLAERNSLAEQLAAASSPVSSPFFHYHASFDAQEIMRRHAAPDVKARPGLVVNFLGVAIDPKFFPHILEPRSGQIEAIPIPANWHADIAEWGAVLRAVDLARHSFTMIELGCGWGCWMNNSGVAARRAGLRVHLIGIEGDEAHLAFAREACEANGFSAEQVTLEARDRRRSPGIRAVPSPGEPRIRVGFGADLQCRRRAAPNRRRPRQPR